MSTSDAVNEFLRSQGAKAFPFENMGDTVSGEIAALDVRQQTDLETGEPLTWKDGSPRQVLVITLQTELQDDESDDGLRTVWARGGNYMVANGKGTSSLTAIKDAIRKAGAKDIEIGAMLTVQYSGTGKSSNRAFTPPKLYSAAYKAAEQNVSLDDLS